MPKYAKIGHKGLNKQKTKKTKKTQKKRFLETVGIGGMSLFFLLLFLFFLFFFWSPRGRPIFALPVSLSTGPPPASFGLPR